MPESMQLVIVNTTPLINLSLIGQIDLLRQLYGEVSIPPAVQAELLQGGSSRIGIAEVQSAGWIHVTTLHDPRRAELLMADLDRGESEVIALAQELNADLVIIDERLARRHAKRLGLKLTGTLGVLLKAKQQGRVPAIKPLIDQLRQDGIWLSDGLVIEALKLAGE